MEKNKFSIYKSELRRAFTGFGFRIAFLAGMGFIICHA